MVNLQDHGAKNKKNLIHGSGLKPEDVSRLFVPQLFDRVLYRKRRQQSSSDSVYFDFAAEISKRLIERLSCFNDLFPKVCQIGVDQGGLQSYLTEHKQTEFFLQADQAFSLLSKRGLEIVCDEENLPLAPHSFNLVIHFLNLQTVNDVPGVLVQTLNSLQPNGLFIAALIGGNSFSELKSVLEKVELHHYQGVSQRVSPWISARDAGSLLQRAGFALPVADCDRLTFIYSNLKELLKDLKNARATTFLKDNHHPPLTKNLLQKAGQIYREEFWDEANQGIKVSVEVIFMTGCRLSSVYTRG
jgi:SAM-dependent methyltransferase